MPRWAAPGPAQASLGGPGPELAAPCPLLLSLLQVQAVHSGELCRGRAFAPAGLLLGRFPPVPASPRVTPLGNPVPPSIPHPSPSPATQQLPFPGLLCARHMDHPKPQFPRETSCSLLNASHPRLLFLLPCSVPGAPSHALWENR